MQNFYKTYIMMVKVYVCQNSYHSDAMCRCFKVDKICYNRDHNWDTIRVQTNMFSIVLQGNLPFQFCHLRLEVSSRHGFLFFLFLKISFCFLFLLCTNVVQHFIQIMELYDILCNCLIGQALQSVIVYGAHLSLLRNIQVRIFTYLL